MSDDDLSRCDQGPWSDATSPPESQTYQHHQHLEGHGGSHVRAASALSGGPVPCSGPHRDRAQPEGLRANNDLEFGLALQLNDTDSLYHSPAQRAGRIVRYATEGIDLHGWTVEPTGDLYGAVTRDITCYVPISRRKTPPYSGKITFS